MEGRTYTSGVVMLLRGTGEDFPYASRVSVKLSSGFKVLLLTDNSFFVFISAVLMGAEMSFD